MSRYILGSSPSEFNGSYLVDRDEVLALLKSILAHAQNQTKGFSDTNRRELTSQVGERVYIKLKSYRQKTVRLHQHPK